MSISRDFASLANQGVANTEFSVLDGITATTAELNALDVSTASGATASTFLRGDATWAAAGSTSASDLTSGTLANARLPAGSIIQTVFHKTAGQPTVSLSSGLTFGSMSTAFKKGITPVKNNSDILIMYQLSMGSAYTGGRHLYFRLYDNTNTQIIGTEGVHGLFGHYTTSSQSVNSDNAHWNVSGAFLYEDPVIASTPNEIEIEVKFGSDRTNTIYLNRRGADATYGGVASALILLEIAR